MFSPSPNDSRVLVVFIPLIILIMNKHKKTVPHCKGKGFLFGFLFIYFVNGFSKLLSSIMLSGTFQLMHKAGKMGQDIVCSDISQLAAQYPL